MRMRDITILKTVICMFLGIFLLNVAAAAPLMQEDFQSVTNPGSEVLPAGWDYNIERDMGVADVGTVDVGDGDIAAYTRGPSAPGASDHITLLGYKAGTFTRANNLRCTFVVYNGIGSDVAGSWAAAGEGIEGSWADQGPPSPNNIMPGGGPFHLPGVMAMAQADETGLTNSGTGLFHSVRIVRHWGFIPEITFEQVEYASRCDDWNARTPANLLSNGFHEAFRNAVSKQTGLWIRCWLDDTQGGKLEWSNDGRQTWNNDAADNSGTGCDTDTEVEINFSTYAGAIIIDDVMVEDDNNYDTWTAPPNEVRNWSVYN